jgi:hypothetical protein
MPALTTEEVLREEAKAIHGEERCRGIDDKSGAALYQALNELNSAALCLSGGGIRSAAFALGVIQALASHPKAPKEKHVATAEDSLLTKFHYLSTVSGGGYIGGWLSAWVMRIGFPAVWANLTGRPDGEDLEPPVIGWLRAYSNYLTPKLGVMSADTLAAGALILRNLALNWFVILPSICVALLTAKGYAFLVAWFSLFSPLYCASTENAAAIAASVAILFALCFTHTQRPAHCDGAAGQRGVIIGSLGAAILAGIFFSLALASPCAHDSLYVLPAYSWTNWSKAAIGLVYGIAVYAFAWVLAFPRWRIWSSLWRALVAGRWQEIRSALPGKAAWKDVSQDIFATIVSGAIFGLLLAFGIHIYLKYLWAAGWWKFDRGEIFLVVLAVPWILGAQAFAEMIFVGLTSHEKQSDSDREWLGRAAGLYLAALFLWVVVMFLVFLASTIASDLYERIWAWATGIGAGGIAAWLGKSSLTLAKGQSKGSKALSAKVIIVIGALLFAVLLIVMASAALDKALFGATLVKAAGFRAKVAENAWPNWPGGWWLWIGFGVTIVVALVASYCVNINRFSLHALYRNRLIRAFLGASHANLRQPNRFTNFDESDNMRVSELWPPEDVRGNMRGAGWQPFHIVNIALNVVSTKRLAWQERKAESFTVSPLHSGTAFGNARRGVDGAWRVTGAYRDSDVFGDPNGISLGTALAVSGAAASPNMGYHSSSSLTFLMTMFNVRLGWWLGNPASENKKLFSGEGPNWAIVPLINEVVGNTTDDSNYIYLSDGGHFENLGLYEIVRRRCKFIIVSDAGCDPDFAFEDLGNAVRKISIDFGVTVTFHGISMLKSRADEDRLSRCCKDEWEERRTPEEDTPLCALGTIDYGPGQECIVLYVKAAYHKAIVRNVGVRSYAIANPDFPHQSTGDQFFSESQFESYRALGFELMDDVIKFTMETLLNNPAGATLEEILRALRDKVVKDGKP